MFGIGGGIQNPALRQRKPDAKDVGAPLGLWF